VSLPDRHLGDRVAALVDGRLTPAERATLLDHVARCTPCRTQYDEQRAIKGLLGDLPGVEAPGELTLRLARLAVPSLPEPGQSSLAPITERHPRTAGRRVRLAGAGLLSVSVVSVGGAYAAGAAPGGLAVVPPVDRFVREHDHVTGGLPLSEPVLARVPPTVPLGSTSVQPSMSAVATASPTAIPGAEPALAASDQAAVAMLQRGLTAESVLAFAGTELIRTAGALDQQLQVTHLPGRGAVVAAVGPNGTDGTGGTGGTGVSAPAVFDADSARWNDLMLGLLSGSYRLVLGPDGVVLGRPTHAVQALRADGSLAATFALDAGTGMLLQRSRYDRAGALIRTAGFTSLRFTVTPPSHLPPMLPSARTAALSSAETTRWAANGWPCPMQLAGLTLVGAGGVPGTHNQMLHLTYSDGLSLVSLFVQAGHLDETAASSGSPASMGGYDVQTATAPAGGQQVFWSAQGWVFTVVSAEPDGAVATMVAALPHDPTDPAAADLPQRLGRGADRMLSWLNPLD